MHQMFRFHPTPEQVVAWLYHIVAMIHIGLATSIIVGGSARFMNPSMTPLYEMVNGAVWIWGFSIFISGVMILAPHNLGNICGLWVGMCWHFFWMGCFTVAVTENPNAAGTTIPMYGGLALICSTLLAVKVLDITRRE